MTDNYWTTGSDVKLTDDERAMLLDRRLGSPMINVWRLFDRRSKEQLVREMGDE